MVKYWFRKRRGLISGDLGWGWRPISWEGWLITLGFIIGLYMAVVPKFSIIYFILIILGFAFIADIKTEDKVLFK